VRKKAFLKVCLVNGPASGNRDVHEPSFSGSQGVSGRERGFLEPVHGGKGTNLLFSNGLKVSSHGYSGEPDGLPTRI